MPNNPDVTPVTPAMMCDLALATLREVKCLKAEGEAEHNLIKLSGASLLAVEAAALWGQAWLIVNGCSFEEPGQVREFFDSVSRKLLENCPIRTDPLMPPVRH